MIDRFLIFPFPVQVGFVFAFGLLIGSFCNVCIYRMPKKKSVVFPGSHCTNCNSPIRSWDNIPVLSYIFLGAKCRSCKTSISVIYPLIELFTGLLIAWAYVHFGLTWEFLIFSIVLPALVVITAIDLEHKIIPDLITLPGIVFGFIAGYYLVGIWDSLFGFLLGGGLFFFLAVVSKGGMGGGDIKFIAAAGALLGWQKVLLIIFAGALLGSIIGGILMIAKRSTRKSQIPFGPFLAIGTCIAIFSGDKIIQLYIGAMNGNF